MTVRRTDARVRRAGGGWKRWGVALAVASSCVAHAGQENLLGIDQSAAQGASATGVQGGAHAAQQAVTREHAQPDSVRVERSEQQSLIVPALPASAVVVDANANAGGAPTAPAAPSAPDERPLWALLKADRLDAYDAQVARLESQFATWRPASALVAERARRQQARDIDTALKGDVGQLRLMVARAPDEFGCAHIDRAWRAAEVFAHAGDRDAVFALYRPLIPACEPARNRLATLYLAQRQLPAAQADALIQLEARQGKRDRDTDLAFQRLQYQRALTALAALPPDDPTIDAQLAAFAPAIRANRDAKAATQAGWITFAQHRPDAAATWFETALGFAPNDVDATIGLAQVRLSQGDVKAADALLAPPSIAADERARKLRGQIALARANDAYREHRYDESLRQLDIAASLGVDEAATGVLRGWTLYGQKQYAQAERIFRERYLQSHDDDSAEGLALALNAQGKSVQDALPGTHGPLHAYGHALAAQRLYYDKAFIAAKAELDAARQGATDPQRIARYVPADLTGIDSPSVAAGLTWSDHVGAAGQGRLNTVAPELRAEWIDGTQQYELRYRQLFLNSGSSSLSQRLPGKLTPDQLGGYAGIPFGGSVSGEEVQGMMADVVRLGGDRRLDWSASLGATDGPPTGVMLDGQARVGQQGPWGAWSAWVGVNPVRDSLLSWRGQTLPNSDWSWGAVRRMASGATARWQILPRWSVSSGAEFQWLTGTNVVGNEGASADLSADYDLRVPGFDYFSAGPAFHYLGYRRNENFYVPGQGGYYSPQWSVATGAAVHMLSEEGRNFQWRATLESGWNDSVQDTVSCFPSSSIALQAAAAAGLDASGGQSLLGASCAGSHDHGPYAHAQIAATVKLSPHAQAGALADVNITPGRDKQIAVMAFLRFFFDARSQVFSRDVAHTTRDFYMQLDDDHN
ncbi:cellulose synthase subunit BcsC-related outer membrane protein [Paraburkholderia sp. J67]|uniref:cellulose synthase subunit BcsC-related outer membrane protein n=1 Tax=Paraburkholderia sp. J67 TaxID=2805435 RepID=UPI002ABDDA36|nr:cellulose synthase subunit BcsC-related outer membrane protein [Paraburkholderia sp. J67]